MKTKQVIVMRKDLNMRKGKMIAQGAHASLKATLKLFNRYGTSRDTMIYETEFGFESIAYKWLEEHMTKICVYVESEEELIAIYNKAKELSDLMPAALILDAGFTEFNGVPTYTCAAIGPWISEEIDKITGHLKLL